MSLDQNDPKVAEAIARMAAEFEIKSLEFAATPIVINRFMLLPSENGSSCTLTLGGGGVAQAQDGELRAFTRPIVSVAFSKNVAEDLVLHLEKQFSISEDDRAKARERNKAVLDQ